MKLLKYLYVGVISILSSGIVFLIHNHSSIVIQKTIADFMITTVGIFGFWAISKVGSTILLIPIGLLMFTLMLVRGAR